MIKVGWVNLECQIRYQICLSSALLNVLLIYISLEVAAFASIGAAVTILALAYDSFVQQILRYPTVEAYTPRDSVVVSEAI